MTILLRIVWINDILVPILAILCNSLLLWLIKTVKTKNLMQIKYSLIPNSFLDILVSAVIFVVAPHIVHLDGNIFIVFGDFLKIFDPYVAGHIVSIFAGLVVISMLSITISFYIRYLVMCRGRILTFRTMIFPYFLLFIIFLTIYVIFLWFYLWSLDFTKNLQAFPIIEFWEEEFGTSPIFVANEVMSPSFLCYCGYLILLFAIAYSLILYYSIKISKTLKTHVDSNNNATKSLHKQITVTLFIQAIGPSLISSVPLLLIFTKSLLKLNSNELSLLLSMSFPWVSMTNPIAAFTFIKPYRKKLKTIFKFVASKPFQRYGITTTKILPATK